MEGTPTWQGAIYLATPWAHLVPLSIESKFEQLWVHDESASAEIYIGGNDLNQSTTFVWAKGWYFLEDHVCIHFYIA